MDGDVEAARSDTQQLPQGGAEAVGPDQQGEAAGGRGVGVINDRVIVPQQYVSGWAEYRHPAATAARTSRTPPPMADPPAPRATPDPPIEPGDPAGAVSQAHGGVHQAAAPPPSWPPGWGAPPPVWTVPADRRPGRRSRPILVTGAAMLAVGIAAGALISEAFARDQTATPSSSITVDGSKIPAGAPGDAVNVAQNLGPAVGTIVNRGAGPTALGSGFVISHGKDISYLLTNNHVVAKATSLEVVMPSGTSFVATVVGTDTTDDLAVISVRDQGGKLPTAVFGKSSDLRVGQAVVAIGSPLGNQGSVTTGVISALHRNIQAGDQGNTGPGETLLDVLQTDASINPGNSGGPLADTQGRVVGVNVANSSQGQSIGFSIPSDVAQRVALDLIAGTPVRVPYIGVASKDPVAAAEAGTPLNGPGVLITQVQAGTPGEKAGIHVNDIMVSIDGVVLDNGETVGGVLQRHRAGDQVAVTLKRGSESLNVTVTLAERPANVTG